MKILTKKKINTILGCIQEYQELSSIDTIEFDLIIAMIKTLGVNAMNLSDVNRRTLAEHVILMLENEINFAESMKINTEHLRDLLPFVINQIELNY